MVDEWQSPDLGTDHGNFPQGGFMDDVAERQIPRDFITAGANAIEAAIRSVIEDTNEANHYARMAIWGKRWKVPEALEAIRYTMEIRRGIKGRASILALESHTQIIAPTLHGAKSEDAKTFRQRSDDREKEREASQKND